MVISVCTAATAAKAMAAVDWQAPWLYPYRATGQAVSARLASSGSVAAALNRQAGAEVRFVPPDSLAAGQAYEAFIRATRCVPTRDDLHDFFNGLVWLTFPLTKRRLNQLQAGQIARDGIKGTRGPLRDALTVLDENGAFLQAPDALWDALTARDWRRLFVEHRPLWREARLTLFGHALLEKLCNPRKSIAAHVLRLPLGQAGLADVDQVAALTLGADEKLSRKPFIALPVLGTPGWWAENEDPSFYDDTQVFRPAISPEASADRGLNRVASPPLAALGSGALVSIRPTFTEF